MNYYAFHLGDYSSATAHLTWEEDLAYRRLMDAYYREESPLPLERRTVHRLVRAFTDQQREAVDSVLDEFFDETPDGWRHYRCDAEIDAVSGKREKASKSAKARWEKANAMRSESERNANAMPPQCERMDSACERIEIECERNAPNPNPNPNPNPSKEHTVEKEKSETLKLADLVAEGVDKQHAKDWLAVRRAKKAPLTVTAWSDLKHEAAKAGLTPAQAVKIAAESNWQGFKAKWLDRTNIANGFSREPVNKQQQLEDANMAVAMRIAERCGQAPMQDDFIGTGDTIIEGEFQYEA